MENSGSYNKDAVSKNCDQDEISLVDIAKIIARRWKMALSALFFSILFGFAFIFIPQTKNSAPVNIEDYVSIYRVAEYSPGKNIVPLKTTLSKSELYYVDLVSDNFMKQNNLESMPFKFEVSVSEDSGYLLVKTTTFAAEKEKIEQIKEVHKQFFDLISKEEAIFLDHRKGILERHLETLNQAVSLLQNSKSTEYLNSMTQYMEQISKVENDLTGFRSGELLKLADVKKHKTEPRVKKNNKLLAVLVIMSGLFLALIFPLFVEFLANVKKSLKEEQR